MIVIPYCNENDSFASSWLDSLMNNGIVMPGRVDRRSIAEVRGRDLNGYDQCHFFAGIGGWCEALRLAAWPSERPVWTGSCPCQPYSQAGQKKGDEDERNLWPEFRRLIAECRPATIFGEQVASKAGRQWLAGVRADLEALGYAVGSADLCAAGAGAPHIRQRFFWVANSNISGENRQSPSGQQSLCNEHIPINGLGHSKGEQARDAGQPWRQSNAINGLEYPQSDGWLKRGRGEILCTDGKTRRIEPGTFPLAHGVPRRMDKLRGYGNAIVPQVAAEFIKAFLETGA
jgi:DNA (cytosine-5)-methyltransferase 1